MGLGFVVAAANVIVAPVVVGYLSSSCSAWPSHRRRRCFVSSLGLTTDRYTRRQLDTPDRRFSLSLARRNGEYRTFGALPPRLVCWD